MARLLLIHPSHCAIERELGEELLAGLRHAELDVECCDARPGLAWLDREIATCTKLMLLEPLRWWPRSSEDLLRRPWLARIRDHVEFDRRNQLGQVAGIVGRGRPTHEALTGLRWFRWRGEWEALLDWACATPQPNLPFDFAMGPAIDGDRRRDDLLAAIDARLAASTPLAPVVALTGAIGSGKTRLLRDWVRRGTKDWIVAHHLALPEHGATLRAELARRSLAAQLHPSATDMAEALAHLATTRPGVGIVLMVDGLERIDDREPLLGSLPPDQRAHVRWLVGARPGDAPVDAATIDLDRPAWASSRSLVEALASEVTRLDDTARQALVERAAGNPGYVAAVAEDAGTRTTLAQLRAQTLPAIEATAAVPGGPSGPSLPRRFEAELARALGRLVELPIVDRHRAGRILDLLALAREPLPAAILLACLRWPGSLASAIEPVRSLLRFHGSEAEPTLALWHPALAECLRIEIDQVAELERELLRGIERAAIGQASASVEAFEAKYVAPLRAQLGLQLEGWLGDVDKLVECLRSEGAAKLELELERQSDGIVGDLLALIRAQRARLDSPEVLPALLWNGLLDRGWSNEQLSERLRWSSKPIVRSRRALDHVDPCWRSLPHPGEVQACAISSDGERVLSGCEDGRVRLWSRLTGEELASFEHGGRVRACVITPDGRWAVSGGVDHVIKRWDVRAGQAAGECKLAEGTIVALAIDDEGTRVLAGDDEGNVVVWRPAEATSELLGAHGGLVEGVAISADGKLGLSGGKLEAVIWDLEANRRFRTLPDHEYSIGAVAIAADGRTGYSLAIGESRRVSLRSGEIDQRYPNLGHNVSCCIALGPGQLLVGQGPRLVAWDMVEGRAQHDVHAHAEVEACAATPDGRWLVSAGDMTLKIWPRAALERSTTARWTGPRLLVAASPDGTRAIVGGDEYELSVVEVATGQVVAKLELAGRTNAVAWIDDDRLLTVGATSHEVAIWSVSGRKQLAMRELGSDWLRSCAISSDRKRALICGDQKQTWLVELDDLERDHSLGDHADWARACRFSSDGELALAVDGDAELLIWSLDDRSRQHRVKSTASYSYGSLATIDDLAFAGGNSSLDVWDVDVGELLASPAVHVGMIHALALADEGRVLVSAGEDATLRLWKVGRSPTVLATVWGHAPFTSVSLAGPLLLAGDAAGNVWELVVDWRALA